MNQRTSKVFTLEASRYKKNIYRIIKTSLNRVGLKTVTKDTLQRCQNSNLKLSNIKRHLLVDHGKLGCHLPDINVIAYEPKTSKVYLSFKIH